MEDCLFCRIQQGQIPVAGGPIYENERVYAHHFHTDEWPAYLGHLLLETKRHTPDFADLTACESKAIGLQVARLSESAQSLHRRRKGLCDLLWRGYASPACSSHCPLSGRARRISAVECRGMASCSKGQLG